MQQSVVDWNKEFVYGAISREDLRSLDIPEEQIALITDETMMQIARKIGDLYVDFGFWEDLRTAVQNIVRTTAND